MRSKCYISRKLPDIRHEPEQHDVQCLQLPGDLQCHFRCARFCCEKSNIRIRIKDLFIGLQEFVVGYSKASEQPQSSARPICHSHAMTRSGREPATIGIAA